MNNTTSVDPDTSISNAPIVVDVDSAQTQQRGRLGESYYATPPPTPTNSRLLELEKSAAMKRRGRVKTEMFDLARQISGEMRATDLSPEVGMDLLSESCCSLNEELRHNAVMISYCRSNAVLVRRLHKRFKDEGYDVWIDVEDIPKGVDWWEAIKAGIESANVCIFCLSKDSLASEVCGWEIDHMIQHNKKVLPIVITDDFVWDDVRSDIAKLNFIFFSRPEDDFDTAFNDLAEAVDKDYGYLEMHTKFNTRAIEWDAHKRDPGVLISGAYLEVVRVFLEKAKMNYPPPSDLMEDFFTESFVADLRSIREHKMLEVMLEVSDDNAAHLTTLQRQQQRVQRLLNTTKFQVAVLVLILIDFLLGMTALILDLTGADDEGAREVIWPISVTLLLIFEVPVRPSY